ncbi:hypothetical protein JM654_19865 [Microbacterium oxydans]|nr:hypothetical protein [Microbacterium oxydans]
MLVPSVTTTPTALMMVARVSVDTRALPCSAGYIDDVTPLIPVCAPVFQHL